MYEEQIRPLIDKLKVLCNLYGIPFVFSAAVSNSATETVYKTVAISPSAIGYDLTDDKSKNIINVLNGFSTIPPQSSMQEEIEAEFNDRSPQMYCDDGTIVTGEDGEMILKEIKDTGVSELLSTARVFDKVRMTDLGNIVNRKQPAQTSRNSQNEQTKAESVSVPVFGDREFVEDLGDVEAFDFSTPDPEKKAQRRLIMPERGRVLYHSHIAGNAGNKA